MNVTLIYVLMATFLGSTDMVVLATSPDAHFCERVKALIEKAPSTHRRYSCETLVSPGGTL